MAKRKTPKVEKIVDLKPEKITEEQLKKVQETVSGLNQCNFEIGGLEVQKHELLHKATETRTILAKLQAEFVEQYGTFDVNINRKLILFFYYITNSMSTINLLTNSIVHSIVFIIFSYANLSYQFCHCLLGLVWNFHNL